MSDLDALDVAGEYVDALVRRDQADQGFMLHRAGVRDLLALRPGEWVLEVGCGTGPHLVGFSEAVGETGGVVAIDKSKEVLEVAASRLISADVRVDARTARVSGGVSLSHGDVSALPDLGRFDAIVADRLLGHLTKPEVTLAELASRLQPGGRLLAVNLLNASTTVNLGANPVERELCETVLSWRAQHGTAGAWATPVLTSLALSAGLKPAGAKCWAFACRSLKETQVHTPLVDYGTHCAAAGGIDAEQAVQWRTLLEQREADGSFAATFVVRADLFTRA